MSRQKDDPPPVEPFRRASSIITSSSPEHSSTWHSRQSTSGPHPTSNGSPGVGVTRHSLTHQPKPLGALLQRLRHKALWRRVIVLLGSLTLLLGAGAAMQRRPAAAKAVVRDSMIWLSKELEPPKRMEPFDATQVLNFVEAQDSWRVQLKTDVRYLTSLVYGGHANQMMGIFNLLALGKLLNRVTIIPTLHPLHFASDLPRNISDFFNTTRLHHDSEIPFILWSQVKYGGYPDAFVEDGERELPPKEEIACWSLFESVTKDRGGGCNPNDGPFAEFHNIDVKYWAMPDMAAGSEGFNVAFDALKAWDTNSYEKQKTWLETVKQDYLPQRDLPPGTQLAPEKRRNNVKEQFTPWSSRTPLEHPSMLCFDNSFFIGSNFLPPPYPTFPPPEPLRSYEGQGWIDAGQHIRFNDGIEKLVDEYLLHHFNVSTLARIPPLITVHIRRGDFKEARGLTSIDKYTDGVARVRKRLQARIDDPDGWSGAGKEHAKYFKGWNADQYKVLATTDEKMDSDFVKELKSFGWTIVDHAMMGTEERFGDNWLAMILDQALLARGRAFVGTEWSTYSYLAGLRVKYWNGGLEEWTPTV